MDFYSHCPICWHYDTDWPSRPKLAMAWKFLASDFTWIYFRPDRTQQIWRSSRNPLFSSFEGTPQEGRLHLAHVLDSKESLLLRKFLILLQIFKIWLQTTATSLQYIKDWVFMRFFFCYKFSDQRFLCLVVWL